MEQVTYILAHYLRGPSNKAGRIWGPHGMHGLVFLSDFPINVVHFVIVYLLEADRACYLYMLNISYC